MLLDHTHIIRMWTYDVRYIYILYIYTYIREIPPLNSLVWGSLTLIPIKWILCELFSLLRDLVDSVANLGHFETVGLTLRLSEVAHTKSQR